MSNLAHGAHRDRQVTWSLWQRRHEAVRIFFCDTACFSSVKRSLDVKYWVGTDVKNHNNISAPWQSFKAPLSNDADADTESDDRRLQLLLWTASRCGLTTDAGYLILLHSIFFHSRPLRIISTTGPSGTELPLVLLSLSLSPLSSQHPPQTQWCEGVFLDRMLAACAACIYGMYFTRSVREGGNYSIEKKISWLRLY